MKPFKSMLGVLTYRRVNALTAMLNGVERYCPQYTTVICEDCGQRDTTADILQHGRKPVDRPELMAVEYEPDTDAPVQPYFPNARVFMGKTNLGVAGNSNRLLKIFMDSDCDHLCLCNDDLFVLGDFVEFYGKAHQDLETGMFCFCDFTEKSPAISGAPESYKWTDYPWRGYLVKFLPRFTGIMISVTRELVEKIGYFDAVFGKFGEEHCDYTIRARLAGGIRLNNQDMNCLDVNHKFLRHQDVTSSMVGTPRQKADWEARNIMQEVCRSYPCRHPHRPFRLFQPKNAAGYSGGGIRVSHLLECGYSLVSDVQQ